MSNLQPPPTWAEVGMVDEKTGRTIFNPTWLKWFIDLTEILNAAGGTAIDHNSLAGLQGGTAAEYYHLTAAQAAAAANLASLGASRVLFTTAGGVITSDSGFTFNTTGDIVTAGALNVTGTTAPSIGWYAPGSVLTTPNATKVDNSLIVTSTVDAQFTSGANHLYLGGQIQVLGGSDQTVGVLALIGTGGTPATKLRFFVDAVLGNQVLELTRTPSALATISGDLTTTGNLQVDGNTTLGNASGDSLTINAGTWTIGSNYTATRAAGALGAGATNILTNAVTATSDSGGGTNARALRYVATFSGSNPWTAMQTFRMECSHAGSALSGSQTGQIANASVDGAGGTTNFNGFLVQFTLSSSGNVANGSYYQTQAPTLSSTGAFTNLVGFNSVNIGHATLVTNAFGFRAEEITASATLTVGFESQVSSGTGKWGFRHSGTANNAFNGNVRIGSNVAPTATLDLTGNLNVSAGTGNIGWGTYTPTLTNVANLDASTAYQCQYMRVGNTVTVSGKVDADPTTPAASTQLGISLPVASNIGAVEDCAGTAFASGVAGQGAAILGDAANNRAQMTWVAGDVTNQPMYFQFTYEII